MTWVGRIPYALVVAGLTAILFGGIVGFAVAAADDDAIPLKFGVAAPHVGDQWEYDFRMSSRLEGVLATEIPEETTQGVLRYSWVEQRPWQDPDGVYRPAAMLYEDSWFDDEEYDRIVGGWVGFVVPFDGDRAMAMFSEGSDPFTLQVSTSTPLGPGSPTVTQSTTEYFETRFRGAIDPYCGYRSNLQGAEVELAHGVRFVGQCEPTGIMDDMDYVPAAVYMPLKVEQVDGMQTVRFREEYRLPGVQANLDLWMARHVPYPVQMAMTVRIDLIAAEPALAEFLPPGTILHGEAKVTMTGFEAGTEPINAEMPLPAPNRLPPIHRAPRQIHGPADTGIDLAYPLSTAFAEARVSTQYADLRDFLATHPTAAVTHARHWEIETDDGLEQNWRFQVDDGVERMTVHARKDPVQPLVEPPVTAGPWRPRFATETELLGPMIDPADRPAYLPTATSVVARWDAMYPGQEANTYRFSLTCSDCVEDAVVFGGRTEVQTEEPPPTAPITGGETSSTSTLHVLGVDEGGRIVLERTERSESTTYREGLVPLDDEPPAKSAPVDPKPIPVASAGVWQMPADAAAAGVGLAAFLAGLLYYLWPVVKAGPMALFSRVQGPGLLEHPVRAQLMAVVQERPGVHYQQIVRDLGKGRGVVEHHIRKLEQSGFITAHKTDGMTCYFPKGTVDRHVMAALPAVKAATAQTILRAIIARPTTTQRDIAATLGVAPSTVNHHVRRLAAAGVIEKVSAGPEIQLIPTQVAAKALSLAAA